MNAPRIFLLSGLLCGLFALITTAVSAQQAEQRPSQPPLIGPLLALNSVAQDHILIYDMASDAWRELRLGTGDHHVWDFSPDGCRLLLTLRQGTGLARLYSVALDGSDLRPMIQFDELPESDWGVYEPSWSPDGTRIAFTMMRDQMQRGEIRRETHIGWVGPEGGVPQFYSVSGREFSPQWSPDGAWLAYVSYDERAAGADVFSTAIPTSEPLAGQTPPAPVLLNEADLWVVSADGETKYRLTSFSVGSVAHPRWSPDGELIAFVWSPSNGNDTFWMIARQEGAIATQLNNQWALILDLTWLPDSTAILGAARDFRGSADNRLWQIPLLGNADETATRYAEGFDLSSADYPRFSPDGRYLALRSAYDLALLDQQSGTMRLLDARARGNTPAIWSPAAFNGEASCP